jgi:hypothetical protein
MSRWHSEMGPTMQAILFTIKFSKRAAASEFVASVSNDR